MVRLRVLYGIGLALAGVVVAVPATREAGWQSLQWGFGRSELKLAQGLVGREVDAPAVAAHDTSRRHLRLR